MNATTKALFGWWSNLDRSPRDVERDIDDEIGFHLDCAAREFEAHGSSFDEARAAARERFGDVTAITAACRKMQLGARITLQRIQLALLVALVLVVGAMIWRSRAAQAASRDELESLRGEIARLSGVLALRPLESESGRPTLETRCASWMAAFQSAREWREGARLADELANLAPVDSTAVLQRIFASIPLPVIRQQVLKAFALRGGRSNTLTILHLGMLDVDHGVRQWARSYLRTYAWRVFSTDEEALAWSTANAATPIADVLDPSIAAFLERVQDDREADEASLALLRTLDARVLEKFATAAVRELVPRTLSEWMQRDAAGWSDELRRQAAREAQHFELDVDQLPEIVRAFVRLPDPKR